MEVKRTTQHVLIKRRPKPRPMKPFLVPPPEHVTRRVKADHVAGRQDILFEAEVAPKSAGISPIRPAPVESTTTSVRPASVTWPQGPVAAILNDLRRSGLDPRRIGTAFLALAPRENGYELVIGLAAALANEVRTKALATEETADGRASFGSARGIAISGGGTIQTDSGVTTTLSGVIADGGGAGALTKTGAGALVLSADNSYTGGTTISAARCSSVLAGPPVRLSATSPTTRR